mgnify:CR=1 FL=1|jgi:signal peptidase II
MQVMQGEGRARLSADPSGGPVAQQRRRRLLVLFVAVAAIVFAVDQVTKAWAMATLVDAPPRQLIGDFLTLELVRNPGAAFSLGTGSTWLLTVLAVVILIVLVRTSRRLGSTGWAWAFGLILGGALGNLVDRLIREPGFGRGHVVDFLDYNGWFIGNVADIAIVAAAVLIALLAFLGIGLDGRRDTGEARGIPDERGGATRDG